MKQTLTFPIWVLILAMVIAPRPRKIGPIWLSRYAAMLEELYQALPVPRTWFQRWAVATLIGWIDKEKEATLLLVQLRATILTFGG
jgi:hypothetical protein